VKRLIVNADDLGLTGGVNRATFELHRAGAVTSATLMASASDSDAAGLLAHNSGLGIGCHVVLVDGAPILPPSEVPTLIDPRQPHSGLFRPTLGAFVYDLIRGRIRESDMEAEAAAQIRHLQQKGVPITHLDTHKHTHILPRVLRPLLRAALLRGVPAIRNPFEPRWSVAATPGASLTRRLQIAVLRSQRGYFLKATRDSGLKTTDGAVGVLATGTLDSATLRSLLAAMPEGTWELVCHPGYRDAQLDTINTRLLASRETERQALLAIIPEAAAHSSGATLINFGQLLDSNV
jgi:predicted glycoside hydrolase/deacetylase ChbG (UPF0249 family)